MPFIEVAGPWYNDLSVGECFEDAPGLTLTSGHAALHQAILGERLKIALDGHLSAAVTGADVPVVHPGLVSDVAIGQSTTATQRVIANLFYRGLVFRRATRIGDTLRTRTVVLALKDTSRRPPRQPAGLAVMRVQTVDQDARPVLDFLRCAMLPMNPELPAPGHAARLDSITGGQPGTLAAAIDGWDLAAFRDAVPGPHGDALTPGDRYVLANGDTVTGAPELVRLTLNVAAAHTDPAAGTDDRRLVYGGHTIGVAFAQAVRALPNIVTVLAWRACEHIAPVFEGDVLRSTVTVEAVSPLPAAQLGSLVDLRVETTATRDDGAREAVLDWRLTVAAA